MAIFKKVRPEFEKLPLKNLYVTSLIFSLVSIVIGIISQIILPPQIPLFFGLPQTEAQLTEPILIVIPSTISILIILTNAFISTQINDNYLKKALAFSTIIVATLAIVATIKVILLISPI